MTAGRSNAGPGLHVLVVGGSGATGRLLVTQLLDRGVHVRMIVRSPDALPESIRTHAQVDITAASLLDLSDADMARHVGGCQAVASCLGHTLSWKGIYGPPRRLVTDATRRLCDAIRHNASPVPVKFVLMNTTGYRNPDRDAPISFAQRCVIALLRILVPPHPDNEKAAEHLRVSIGQNDDSVSWGAVRPDSLIDEEAVSAYELHPSPVRSAIFDAGKTSRINVAHFMAELICDDDVWEEWKGQMPVIYNREGPHE